MAKPILEIPVDDEQVKKFLDLLGKIQKTVGEDIPAGWAAVGASMDRLGGSFASNFEAMIKQQKALHDEVELRLANERAAKKETDAAKAKAKETDKAQKLEKKAQDDRAKANKKTIDDTKKIASNVASTTLNLLKWVSLGGAVGAIGSAAGFWGLDRLAAGVGNERRLAQGFGISTAERQSLAVNFQRYFDVNGALGQVSEAQTDPAKQWIWSSLGIRGAQTKDAAQLLLEATQRVHDLLRTVPTNQLQIFAHARGLDQLFSLAEMRTIKGLGQGELSGQYGAYQKDLGRFALSDEVSRKWQDFTRGLDEAGWALKNNFMDHLVKAEPGLIKIMDAMVKVADTAIDKIDWDRLAKGVDDFGKYIGSDAFQANVKTFISDFVLVTEELVKGLQWLGLIPKDATPSGAMSSGGGPAAEAIGAAAGATAGSAFGWPGMIAGGVIGAGVGSLWNGAQKSRLVQFDHDYNLGPGTLEAIYGQETGYGKAKNQRHMTKYGVVDGPFQLLDSTAKQYGVGSTGFYDQSLGAAKILRDLLKLFHGDISKAFAAYDEGAGAVQSQVRRYGANWLSHAPAETQGYVKHAIELKIMNQTTGAQFSVTGSQLAY